MSKVLTNYIAPSFADDVIAALNTPKKGVLFYDHAVDSPRVAGEWRDTIRRARRFEVEPDITELAWHRSLGGWSTLWPDLQRAMAPFDLMWVEWDEKKRQDLVKSTYESAESGDVATDVGYIIKKVRSDTPLFEFYPFFRVEEHDKVIANPLGFAISPSDTKAGSLYLSQDKEFRRAYALVKANIDTFRFPEQGGLETFAARHNLSINSIEHAVDAINGKTLLVGGKLYGSTMSEHPWSTARLISAQALSDNGDREAHVLYKTKRDWNDMMSAFERISVLRTPFMSWKQSGEPHEADLSSITSIAGDLRFVVSLIAMINYDWVAPQSEPRRSSVKTVAYGKKKPNSVYYRLGLTLPKEEIKMRLKEPKVSTPRREHDVRGHWRRLETKTVWVSACKRGDPSLGTITKDYVLLPSST